MDSSEDFGSSLVDRDRVTLVPELEPQHSMEHELRHPHLRVGSNSSCTFNRRLKGVDLSAG